MSRIIKEGFRVPVSEAPPLTTMPVERPLKEFELDEIQTAVDVLVRKRAVIKLTNPVTTPGFYSQIFTVPKKNSTKRRVVHNLRCLNRNFLCPPPYFRLINVAQLRRLIQPREFMVSLDLADAYLHVPIHPESQHLLRFILNGQHYQWRVLPFGISWAPWLFTRITTPIRVFLQLRGISIPMYLDDLLIHKDNRQLLLRQLQFTQELLTRLGWMINLEKSDLLPVQRLQFIGGLFDTHLSRLFVPPERFHAYQPLLRQALSGKCLPLRHWLQLLGHLTACQYATSRGRLQLRPIQRFLYPLMVKQDMSARIAIPQTLRAHLEWWTVEINVLAGIPIQDFHPQTELVTDASRMGWGAHMDGSMTAGVWNQSEKERHINQLEMLAVFRAVRYWSPRLHKKAILISSDNQAVVAAINRQGTTRSAALLNLTFQLFTLIDALGMEVRARHIPGVRNVLADALSRPDRKSSTEWSLHPDVFQAIRQRYDVGVIDLFATHLNHKLPLFVSPIPDPRAWKIDALSLSWEGLVAYAFPPPVLLHAVVDKIKATQTLRLVLVAPWWPARPWFPQLRELAQDPWPLPRREDLLRDNVTRRFHDNPDMFNLHVWNISREP